MNNQEHVPWFNLSWWIIQLKQALKGPRGVVVIALALIGVPCSICSSLVLCPIHVPVLALLAGYFSVRQERIQERQEAGIVGAVSAVSVALIDTGLSIAVGVCFLIYAFGSINSTGIVSANDPYTISGPFGLISTVIIDLILLIIAGILGYYAGYLSVTDTS